jgi:hypothetical protein
MYVHIIFGDVTEMISSLPFVVCDGISGRMPGVRTFVILVLASSPLDLRTWPMESVLG